MKRVKTDLRNRLITTTLDHLLRITICGPELKEYDFNRATDEWGAMRNRRIQLICFRHAALSYITVTFIILLYHVPLWYCHASMIITVIINVCLK